MRAGLSTIHQTLTPAASSVLNSSIAEAGRRNHGQTTPLHVAAALLSSPTGFLREACVKSHPNSSHPLQCRALELCFSVALERLPTAQASTVEPPISNALMAALKRAQAHQRRGCPEQLQQPLLAIKVELEQLIISILDDPSVSRVMREASFSSPAVKAAIEQSLNSTAPPLQSPNIEIGFRSPVATPAIPGRNLYLNPRLQGGSVQTGQPKVDEMKKVIDILLRKKKRNPVLVGESEPETVVKELLKRIELNQLDEFLKNIQVIPLDKEIFSAKSEITKKVEEFGDLIETSLRSSNGGGIIFNLGDLKWVVEQPASVGTLSAAVSETSRLAVSEIGKLAARFVDSRVWLVGTATCETYLRCQVYYPAMENDWDLHALPVASRSPGLFQRTGGNGGLSSSVESLSPVKGAPIPMMNVSPMMTVSRNSESAVKASCCPQCLKNYDEELAKYTAQEGEKSCSELKQEAASSPLPPWLQDAKARDNTDQIQKKKENTQELEKKWSDLCFNLHPSFHRKTCLSSDKISPVVIPSNLYNPNLMGHKSVRPKLQSNKNIGESLQMSTISMPGRPTDRNVSPPSSPVGTELVLGQNAQKILKEKLLGILDPDSFKKLLKTLTEKIWWQPEAASAVATTVMQCKLGNGKQRGGGSKGDIWLLFIGPDKVGKRKMALALAQMASSSNPVVISLGSKRSNEDSAVNFRGKTAMDRISETIRKNPSSVIVLEEIDEADLLVRGSIKRALEKGRLTDSHGREISVGNAVFILTATWLPENLNHLSNSVAIDEQKIADLARGSWQLRLCVSERRSKRNADWNYGEDRSTRHRNDSGLGFDLNETAEFEDDSEISIDRALDRRTASLLSLELRDSVDDAIVFKPVEFDSIKEQVRGVIEKRFSAIAEEGAFLEIQELALEKIVAGMWLGNTGVEEWVEKLLVPGFRQLKLHFLNSGDATVMRLELAREMVGRSDGEWLPDTVKVVI